MAVTIGPPPLTGRDDEVRTLDNLLAETISRQGSFVLVAGEAGIGKTRLVEEFAKLAAKKGANVMIGKCLPGAPSPYLPFRDAFERQRQVEVSGHSKSPKGIEQGSAGENEFGIAAWIKGPSKSKGKERTGAGPVSDSERTLHSTLEYLRENSRKRPALLILEDLHWADSATTQLLHFLARNTDAHRTLLIGTYRPEEAFESGDRANPLLENLRAMRREGLVRDLELDRLTPGELRIAMEGMLHGKLDAELLGRIADESGGNALFAVETVRLLVQSGAIADRDGAWKFVGQGQIEIPPTVKEVILRRIERLSPEERRMMESAAILGETFDPETLGRILGLEKLSLLEKLDSIARHYQLVAHSGSGYRFTHDKIRQTLYEEISVPRRTELHKLAGEVMEARGLAEGSFGELSSHFYYAQIPAKCLHYSVLAGLAALNNGAAKEAANYFERALEVAGPKESQEKLEALEGAGDAYRAMGLYQKSVLNYDRFAKDSKDPNRQARGLRKSAEVNYPSLVPKLLDQAQEIARVSDVEAGRVKRARGHLALSSGAFQQAQALFLEAETLYEKSNATEDLGYLHLDLAAVNMALGDTNMALEQIRGADRLLSAPRTAGTELAVTKQFGDLYMNMGRMAEASESFGKVIEIGLKYARFPSVVNALYYRSGVYLLSGDLASAIRDAKLSYDYAVKTESLYDRMVPTLLLAHLNILQGRLEEGERLLQEVSSLTKTMAGEEIMGIVAGADQFYSDPAARFYSVPFLPAYMALLQALLSSARRDWALSDQGFQTALELFKGSVHSVFFRGYAHSFYAESLLKQGRIADGKEQLQASRQAFAKLGNQPMVNTLSEALSKLP